MPAPATNPTIYFIGVTTAQSSILKIFPHWAQVLGLGEAEVKGVDFPLHAPREAYRAIVEFIRDDPHSCGALVTTHKVDLFHACRDLFADIDPLARSTNETSCLSKRPNDHALVCHAKDPVSAGLALEAFLPASTWAERSADAFLMGAGGAAIAISYHLLVSSAHPPRTVIVTDRSPERLEEIKRLHQAFQTATPIRYERVTSAEDNDCLLERLRPGSLVVNATGLGKDGPGSPISDGARFPESAFAWELNYRGELHFLAQARMQQRGRRLRVEDGWTYFIHGWTRVIAEVFHVDIPTVGPVFDRLSSVAAEVGSTAR
jgi:shikimate 5-dehydrogenase